MPLGSLIDGVVILAFAALLIGAAITDARDYLIPNRLCLAILGLYPVHAVLAWYSGMPINWPSGLGISAAIFVIGLGLFARGVVGGGDVKLLAVAALWAGPEGTPLLLIVTGLAGALVAIAMLLRGWLRARQAPAVAATTPVPNLGVPYGVAIAAGGLMIVARLLSAASTNWSA